MIPVVFASRDGADRLALTLPRFAALRPPPGGFRLVVVDSASRDGTEAALRAHLPPGFPLTLLREPLPGKNRALNRAIAEVADADLVVLTDDDVLPEPDWLLRLHGAASANPEVALFGGAIRPHWLAPPPAWLLDWGLHLGVLYAATAPRPSGPVAADLVWGPNMAVRGSIFRAGHRFDEGTGPDGSPVYGMGSETEFTTRLARAGHRAWFVSDAVVGHLVRPEQMTEAWVLARAFRHGLGYPRYHPVPPPRRGGIGGLPAGIAARAAAYGLAAAALRPMPASALRLRVLWQAAWLGGVAAALRGAAAPRAAGAAP